MVGVILEIKALRSFAIRSETLSTKKLAFLRVFRPRILRARVQTICRDLRTFLQGRAP